MAASLANVVGEDVSMTLKNTFFELSTPMPEARQRVSSGPAINLDTILSDTAPPSSGESSVGDDCSDDFVLEGMDVEAPTHRPCVVAKAAVVGAGEPMKVVSPRLQAAISPAAAAILGASPLTSWARSPSPCRASSPNCAWPSTPEFSPVCAMQPMRLPVDDLELLLPAATEEHLAFPASTLGQSQPPSPLPVHTDLSQAMASMPWWAMLAAQAQQTQQFHQAQLQAQSQTQAHAVIQHQQIQTRQIHAQQVEQESRNDSKQSRSSARGRRPAQGRQYDGSAIMPAPVKPQQEPSSSLPKTTVMLRNMPNNQTRKMLMDLLDRQGFTGQYDFLYLPMDFTTRASMGYAFVNFVSPGSASQFMTCFDGFSKWSIPSRKVCGVSWSGPHQGLEAHVERYRNSPVMHVEVPDNFKPVLLQDGMRINFPVPTRKLRAPRIRGANSD